MQHSNPPLRSYALFLLAVLFATAVTLPVFAQKTSVHPSLITGAIDENQLVPLKGNLHPAAIAANDRGIVDDGEPLGHVILLLNRAPELEKQLAAAIDQLHNSKSPKYHQWLTAEQFGEQYGLSDADLKAVTDWLQAKGFTVEDIPPGRTHIVFTGTVGQIRAAFHTEIHKINVHGELHRANMSEPKLPAALAPAIRGFRQLTDFRAKPLLVNEGVVKHNRETGRWEPVSTPGVAPAITFTPSACTITYNGSCTFYVVTPQDFYTIYNETPVLSSAINGAGVTIAVLEDTEVVHQSDVASFRSQFGLAAYPATPNATQGGVNWMYGPGNGCTAPPDPASLNDEHEALLDVEWAGTAAPNAIIDFVACNATGGIGGNGTDLAASYVVNYLDSTVSATSLSYGLCELDTGSSGASFYSALWQQGAAEGITHVVSSMDGGPAVCDQNAADATQNISVNAMASTAYNVSAGGTDFGDAYITKGYITSPASTWWNTNDTSPYGSAISYLPEISWGGYCSNPLLASYLQQVGDTRFGTTYTPVAICNNATAIADGLLKVKGGSGGVSAYNALPTWQGVYGIGSTGNSNNTSTAFRNQPDVSLFAASGLWNHFLLFCDSDTGYAACTYSNSTDAYALKGGGTSFVAPQLAGVMALIVQKTGQRQGVANYTFYGLAAQEYGTTNAPNASELATCSGSAKGAAVGSSCIFRDISNDTPSLQGGTIASDIAQPCLFSSVATCWEPSSLTYGITSVGNHPAAENDAYASSPGYDLATGLGSVNISNLVNNWNTLSPGFATTTALATSASSIPPSGSATLTATVTATGRGGAVAPAGAVEFYEGSTSGTLLGQGTIFPSCTGSGAAITCNGIATLIVPGSALNPGSNSIVAYFEGDAANDSPSTSTAVSVTVTATTTTITLSPKSLTFAKQLVGTTSSAKTIKLTNSGTGTLTINNILLAGNFAQTNNCPGTLAIGASCTFSVTFTPTVVGAVSGAISLYDNASGSPQVAPLSGTGAGAVTVAPATLSFVVQTVGTTSPAKTVTVTNNNAASVSLSFTASGDYAAAPGSSNGCGATLAAKANCTIAVTFSPQQSGAINGSLAISGSGFATQMVALTGSGSGGPTATLSFSPATASITSQVIGTTSAPKVVTITNKGTSAVTINSLTASPEFTAVGSGATPCGGTLAAAAKCTFSVTFTPSVTGSIKGSVTIANNSTVNPMLYPLSGTSVLPVTFAPASLAFAAQAVGTTSAPKIVTLTNNQTVLLNITSITVSGDYAATPSGTTPCGATVAPKGKCTFQVTFTPTVTGTVKGAVDIVHDAPRSPQVVGLTGTGQ